MNIFKKTIFSVLASLLLLEMFMLLIKLELELKVLILHGTQKMLQVNLIGFEVELAYSLCQIHWKTV